MPRCRDHIVITAGAFKQPTPEKAGGTSNPTTGRQRRVSWGNVAVESPSSAIRQLRQEDDLEEARAPKAEELDSEAAAPGWVRGDDPAAAPRGGSTEDSCEAAPCHWRHTSDIAEDCAQVSRRELHLLLQALEAKLQNDMTQLEAKLRRELMPHPDPYAHRASDLSLIHI